MGFSGNKLLASAYSLHKVNVPRLPTGFHSSLLLTRNKQNKKEIEINRIGTLARTSGLSISRAFFVESLVKGVTFSVFRDIFKKANIGLTY